MLSNKKGFSAGPEKITNLILIILFFVVLLFVFGYILAKILQAS